MGEENYVKCGREVEAARAGQRRRPDAAVGGKACRRGGLKGTSKSAITFSLIPGSRDAQARDEDDLEER